MASPPPSSHSTAIAVLDEVVPQPELSENVVVEQSRAPGVRRPRLAVLDALRLLAALMVVSWHFIAQGDFAWEGDSQELFGWADRFTAYGWLGVDLFFVISGFVICMSAWGKRLGDFVVSRVTRLYPAYWFAIAAITVAVSIAPLLQTRMISSEILINLTMFQHAVGVPGVSAVFWTLWNELHFYLLFGLFVVWRGTTYRRVLAFCALWTVGSLFAEMVRDPVVSGLAGQTYSPFFIGGVVIYLMHRYRPTLLLWGMLGISYALAMLKSVTLTRETTDFVGYELDWTPTAAIVTAAFAGVAVVALVPRVSRIQSRWLTVAGAMTYPLYLMHLEIGWLLIRAWHDHIPVWPLVALVVGLMLLAAYGVHRFVERPVAPRLRSALSRSLSDLRDPEAVARR